MIDPCASASRSQPGFSLPSDTPPGGWICDSIQLAGRRFAVTRPADPDAVLERFSGVGDPYWSQLWPSSRLLAQAILQASWAQPPHAVELGCGVGLAGLALLAIGGQVTFTDYEPSAIALALHNAQANGFSAAQGMLLDWRTPPPMQFDFVIAADVLYDRQLHQPLLSTLKTLLPQAGVCWIGEPGRSTAEEFLLLAADQGWHTKLYDEHGALLAAPRFNQFTRIVLRPPIVPLPETPTS
jgi:predicted nicotinamide N-methyase